MDINWKNVTKINYIETKDNILVQCGEGDGSFFHTVPVDENNRHYQDIKQKVKDGEITIGDVINYPPGE